MMNGLEFQIMPRKWPDVLQCAGCKMTLKISVALAMALLLVGLSSAQECYNYGSGQEPRIIDTKLMLGGHILALDINETNLIAGAGQFLNWCSLDDEGLPTHEIMVDCGGEILTVVLDGSWVYVAAANAGLVILDFETPTAPEIVAQVPSEGFSNDVAYADDHLYLADSRGGLRIFDISDRTNPIQVAQQNLPAASLDPIVRHVEVENQVCWIGAVAFMYRVLDVEDPSSPQMIDEWVDDWENNYLEELHLDGGLLHLVRSNFDWSTLPEPPHITKHIVTMDASDPRNIITLGGGNIGPGEVASLESVGTTLAVGRLHELLILDFTKDPIWRAKLPLRAYADDIVAQDGLLYLGVEAYLDVVDAERTDLVPELGAVPTDPVYRDLLLDGDRLVCSSASSLGGTPETFEGSARVYDVSDPSALRLEGEFGNWSGPELEAHGVCVADGLNYGGGVVVDIQTSEVFGSTQAMGRAETVNGALYVPTENGLEIEDRSNPRYPSSANQLFAGRAVRDLAVIGDWAYISVYGMGVTVCDVSDPLNPLSWGALVLNPEPSIVESAGSILMCVVGGDVYFYDATNARVPNRLGIASSGSTINDISARGSMFYATTDEGSILVGDASDLTAPKFVREYTPPRASVASIELHPTGFYTWEEGEIYSYVPDCTDQGGETVGIDDEDDAPVPAVTDFSLHPAVPNPFNPETRLSFTLERTESVVLAIYDLAGKRVRSLVAGVTEAGHHAVTWGGEDARGVRMASGVYLARLETPRAVEVRKLVMIK